MKKTREDFKFVPFISQELKRRTTKGKKTKYVEQALLRQFEWEDRNKKEEVVRLTPLEFREFIGPLHKREVLSLEEFKKRYPSK